MDTLTEKIKKKTVLGYELTYCQDAWVNYLVPSASACILYILLIASDVATIYSHFKNGDPIWCSLTIFFMYLPVLASFVLIVSNWELWPEFEECGRDNTIWFWTKVFEHLFFPIWSMWRYAERIFWSLEAVRARDEYSVKEILSIVNSPRSIELYNFLQSYLHSLPQVLLQFYILIRHNTNTKHETAEAQVLCIIFNLLKISVTTTYYQRFRSQKLTGKQYPWYKTYKLDSQRAEEQIVLRRTFNSDTRSVMEDKRNTNKLEDLYDIEPPRYYSERRRSSDIYLEPSTSDNSKRQTLLETDFDTDIITKVKPIGSDELDKITHASEFGRETSILDGPQRRLYRETGISERSEPDFNVSRVVPVKGLESDDFAGQLVSILWWFSFLLTRVLAISMSAYFFNSATTWLIIAHYLFVISVLLYDVKSDEVKRDKTLFFIFIGYVYIFCIIEFKIRFKKATAVYYGFFALVFLENFGLCLSWYIDKVEYLENDFWCRYAFYIVVIGTVTSFSSMVFYLILNKPKKVVVDTKVLQPKP